MEAPQPPPPAVSSTDEKEAAIGMSDLASSSSPSSRKKRALTASRHNDPDSSYAPSPSPSLTSSGEDDETDDDEAQNDEKEELDNEGAEQVMEEDIVQEKFMFVAGPLKHSSADGELSTLLEEVDIEDAKRCVGVVQRLCRNRIQWLAPLMEFVYFYNLGMTAKQMEKDPEFYNIFFDETRAKTKRNISSFANDVNRLLTLEGYKVVSKIMEADKKKKTPEKYWMITRFERTKQQEFEARLKEYTESVSQLAHAAVHHYEMTQQLQVEKDETAKHKRQTTEHRMKVHELENKLQQALQKIQELEAQPGELQSSRQTVVELMTDLQILRSEHDKCGDTLAKLHGELDRETTRASKAENELGKARADNEKLRYELQLSASDTSKDALQQEIVKLQNQLSRKETEAQGYWKLYKSEEVTKKQLQAKNTALETDKAQMVAQRQQHALEFAALSQNYTSAMQGKAQLQLEQQNLSTAYTQLESNASQREQEFRRQIEALKREQPPSSRHNVQRLRNERDTHRNNYDTMVDRNKRLEGDIAAVKRERDMYKDQLVLKDALVGKKERAIGTLEERIKNLSNANALAALGPQEQVPRQTSADGVQNKQ